MEDFFGRPAIRVLAIVVVLGVLLGVAAAVRRPPPAPPVLEASPVGPADEQPSFASYFVHFFPGRTHDGSRPTNRKQLLRASRFLTGERVGLRAQTTSEVEQSFVIGIRFLTPDTQEELSELYDDRQAFRIRPGLRTYCCLRMPKESGDYTMAVSLGEEFIAYYSISVKEPSLKLEGGLLTRPEGE